MNITCASNLTVLLILTGVAALEATPIGYLIPGVLGIIGAGSLVQAGKLPAIPVVIAVWLGVFIGDCISFCLARAFGNVLRKWPAMAGTLARAESRLGRNPIGFVTLAHFSPFIKNIAAPAAALSGMSWRRFLALEVFAAAVDALWFLGLGFVVGAAIGNVTELPLVARVVGVVAFLAAVGFVIGSTRKCKLPRKRGKALTPASRKVGYALLCAAKLPFWEIFGRFAKSIAYFERPELRAALVEAVRHARAGDLILVGRSRPSPWGDFSHIGIIVATPAGLAVLHAYEGAVQLTAIALYPMSGRVCIVRVICGADQTTTALATAWAQLGKPFKLSSRNPGTENPGAFNCVGLAVWAFAQAGVRLVAAAPGQIVVPDDVFAGASTAKVFDWSVGAGRTPALLTAPAATAEEPGGSAIAASDAIIPHEQLCRLISNVWYAESIFAARCPDGVCVDFHPSLISPADAPSVTGVHHCPRESRPDLNWKCVWADGVAIS